MGCSGPPISSSKKERSQTASLLAWVRATYSASVLERAVDFCFRASQLTAAFAIQKAKPVKDLRSSFDAPESAST